MLRLCSALVMLMSIVCTIGCNEITTTGERTTAVDVVGDSRDATQDSAVKSDIYGSGNPLSDETDSIVHARPVSSEQAPPVSDPDELIDDQDVAGGNGIAKPVSLKSRKPEPKPSK